MQIGVGSASRALIMTAVALLRARHLVDRREVIAVIIARAREETKRQVYLRDPPSCICCALCRRRRRRRVSNDT